KAARKSRAFLPESNIARVSRSWPEIANLARLAHDSAQYTGQHADLGVAARLFQTSTSTSPFLTFVLKVGCGVRAGPAMTAPVRTSNLDPCQGHSITCPSNVPLHKGPPACVHLLSRA